MTPFRSLLFVPGARSDRFAKALGAGADAVCIDLEDAVPPAQKAQARRDVGAFLAERGVAPGPALGVRINALSTLAGFADVASLASALDRLSFLMVPKVQSGEEIGLLHAALGQASPPLWPIVESARGLEAAHAIAAAPGVAGLLFGAADFSADIGATLEWEALAYARGRLASACGAAGVQALDVPYLDVRDAEGLRSATLRAKALGFTGRACIHPDQVGAVNACFTPSEEELAWARRVAAASREAQGAAALLDGKLIELPVLRAARRILDRVGEH